ncbi:MAG: hypothetical protein EHM24_25985, partial [Acidobacteria bacterium]
MVCPGFALARLVTALLFTGIIVLADHAPACASAAEPAPAPVASPAPARVTASPQIVGASYGALSGRVTDESGGGLAG